MKTCWTIAAAAAVLSSAGFALAGESARSSALSATPGESSPMHNAATTRSGFVVWDQGAPDLFNGNECTQWNQGENFSIGQDTTLTACLFWTIEPGAFDGTLQWVIWTDAGGSPGAVLYSGSTGPSRFATGRNASFGPEFENSFSFPSGTDLNPGNYYLTLHMSADCGDRDDVYWETGAIVVNPQGVEDQFCDGGWNGNAGEHAFVLFGKPTCSPPAEPNNPLPYDGQGDVPSNTILTWNNLCTVGNLQNPGFETGDFSGWTAAANVPAGGELVPWNVSTGGTGYFGNAFPFEGSYYAQNGFDGGAGLTYDLWQEVFIPPSSTAFLTWRERIQYDSLGIVSNLPRVLTVTVQPAGGGAPLATIHQFSFVMNGAAYTDTGYVTHSIDLASLGLTGQIVRLNWHQLIPEEYTGPAQIEFDGFSLACETPFTPVPAVTAVRRTMSDEAFAAKVAMYQAVRSGQFRSPAEAMASGRFTVPPSASAVAKQDDSGEDEPLDASPVRGISALLFDGGGPDLANGNEQANWNQTEDFDAASDSYVHYVRFWTLEISGTWDGQCQVSFYSDAGGAPAAAPYFNSGASLVSRTLTGRSNFGLAETEYVFSIPGGAFVPQGRNWLGLHMSGDCTSFDNVYWETTGNSFGNFGHEFINCGGSAINNGNQHAFQLYGEDAECPVTYDVYLRRIPDGNYQLVCAGATLPQCDPGRLACETEYEWVVIAYNAVGSTQGPFWQFRTARCCCPGDADGNRVVNFADITEVLTFWGFTCP
jgi:hypothetical protein